MRAAFSIQVSSFFNIDAKLHRTFMRLSRRLPSVHSDGYCVGKRRVEPICQTTAISGPQEWPTRPLWCSLFPLTGAIRTTEIPTWAHSWQKRECSKGSSVPKLRSFFHPISRLVASVLWRRCQLSTQNSCVSRGVHNTASKPSIIRGSWLCMQCSLSTTTAQKSSQ